MFQFWCPFCKRWHLHGYRKGHRVAHCHDTASPFYETGYIVEPYTKAELLEIRARIDEALEQGVHGRSYDKKLPAHVELRARASPQSSSLSGDAPLS